MRGKYVLRIGTELVDRHLEDVLRPVVGVHFVQLLELHLYVHKRWVQRALGEAVASTSSCRAWIEH